MKVNNESRSLLLFHLGTGHFHLYLTIIPRESVGYELIHSQRGATCKQVQVE